MGGRRGRSDGRRERRTDAGPVPTRLLAVTVNEYAVPFVSPPIVQLGVPVVVQVAPPGLTLTTYEVMAAPPSDEGGAQSTATQPLPGVVEPMTGAPGTVATAPGVTARSADLGPSPTRLTALT